MDRTKITPKELKRFVEGSVRRTPYTPKALKDAMYELGAKPTLAYDKTMTKREFFRFVKGLKAKAKEMPRLIRQLPLRPTEKKLYQGMKEESAASENTGSNVPLASDKIPQRMAARKFVEYYGRVTGKSGDVKEVLRQLNLPAGPASARPGMEPYLSKRQMVVVLNQLRGAGKLTHPNVGADLRWMMRQERSDREWGWRREEQEKLQRIVAAIAQGKMEREELPPGVERTIGRISQGSALHSVGQWQKSTSAGRSAKDQAEPLEPEEHATTASELARKPRPKDPKSSAQRFGKSAHRAPELPHLSFDID